MYLTPNRTGAGLMYGMKRRPEMHPMFGPNGRRELFSFSQREYRELQRFVGRLRIRGTENDNNSHSAFIAPERECNNSVCGCDPFPKPQKIMPAAVANAPQELG